MNLETQIHRLLKLQLSPLWLSAIFCWCSFGLAQSNPGDLRYIGHIPRENGGFEAAAMFSNHSSLDKEIRLVGYTESGERVSLFNTFFIGGNQLLQIPIADLFPIRASHIAIFGSRQVSVSLRVSALSTDRGSDSILNESSVLAKRYRIFPSIEASGQDYWEGMAVTSFSPSFPGINSNTEVTLALKNQNNEILDRYVVPLADSGKILIVFKTIFPAIKAMDREQYYYDLSASSEVAVTVLKGNTRRLDVSTAHPLSPLPLATPIVASLVPSSFPSFEWSDAVLEGGVLNVEIVPQFDCGSALNLYWDGNFSGPPDAPEVNLSPAFLARGPGLCFTFANPIAKEFDLSTLVQDTGLNLDLLVAPVIRLNLLDEAGALFKSIDWNFRE